MLSLLSDGRFHSGEALGATLGISRAAVWKCLRQLDELGLQLDSVRGRGYRLADPLELLDRERILQQLAGTICETGLLVLPEVDSTNAELLRRAAAGSVNSPMVCLAERQTAGRGRRGRVWYSPYGHNLYLSLLWRFESLPAGVSALSLGAAEAVARVLATHGADGVGLKWPNDVEHGSSKLAGILAEMNGESGGTSYLVIGVGLNLRMQPPPAGVIERPWVDLASVIEGPLPSRNRLAADLITALVQMVREYEQSGVASMLARWRQLDAYRERQVVLHFPERQVSGVARGIADDGSLLLFADGEERAYAAGELSLRSGDAAG